MNIKKFLLLLILLLVGINIVSATFVDDYQSSDDNSINEVIDNYDNQGSVELKNNIDTTDKYDESIISKNNIKYKEVQATKTIKINSTNYDDYVTNKQLNDNVNDGDTLDFQGILDDERFSLTINKPVNIISSTNDAYIGSDGRLNFTIDSSASGTNISSIHFHNTHFVVKNANNININNITVEVVGIDVGSGQGVTSIREGSSNITINNSYFYSEDNLGVSTLVCAVAENVLIENCTIKAVGFCGNLVYFTTYNTAYDTTRGYGNRNITFRNNYINGTGAIKQSICYALVLEGIEHTIENNIIDYDYYCIQQQVTLAELDQVSQIIIRNNTIPQGTNVIAYAQVENNTFNEIIRVGNVNFTNNIVNDINITNKGNYVNNTMNSLNIHSNDVNLTNNNITTYVNIDGNNVVLKDNSVKIIVNGGKDNIIDSASAIVVNNLIIINWDNYRDYSSYNNRVLTINNIDENSLVFVQANTFYGEINSIVFNTTGNNIIYKLDSSNAYNLNITGNGITIYDTNMSFADIYANTSTKLIDSVFLSSNTIDNFVLENSTIYSSRNNWIILDDINYDEIFNKDDNTILNTIDDESTIVIRNKTSNGVINNYEIPIILNKEVNIISFDNTKFNANISFIEGSNKSNLTGITLNATLNIQTNNISVTNNKINNIVLNNSKYNLINNNTILSDDTTVVVEQSSNNVITNNNITTNSSYSIAIDEKSSENNITNNYLKSSEDYNDYTINANFENNNIHDNLPAYNTSITLEIPTNVVLNTPVEVNITVEYYKSTVTNGNIVILINNMLYDNLTLTDGKITTNITFTKEGINKLNVLYEPTEMYSESSLIKNITSNKIKTDMEFTQLSSVKVGENMTVTLKLTSEDERIINEGEVLLTIQNDTYKAYVHESTATINIITKENYLSSRITAYYTGTLNLAEKTITSSLSLSKGDAIIKVTKIQKIDNTLALTVTPTDINGVNITTGYVRVTYNGNRSSLISVSNYVVVYNITPIPTESFEITAELRSSTAFNNVEQKITLDPIERPIDAKVTLTADNTKVGENITLTINLEDNESNLISDNIIIYAGNNNYTIPVSNGKAVTTITTTESMYYTGIIAQLEPNENYNQATSNNITLEKGEVLLTLTQKEENDNIIITVKVTDINQNPLNEGNVIFTLNNQKTTVSLENSQATYRLDSNITSNITVDVLFTNNEAFNDKNDELLIEYKQKDAELKIDTTEFIIGQKTSLTASIYRGDKIDKNINGGKIVFKVNGVTLKDENGKVIYAKLINGTATITDYEIPSSWNKTGLTITAVYSGSTQYNSLRSQETKITITIPQPTITSEDITAKKLSTIQLNAKITLNNNPITAGKVAFKINGKTVKDENGKVIYVDVDDNGQVNIDYKLPNTMKTNTYTITIIYTGNNNLRVENTQKLTITQ